MSKRTLPLSLISLLVIFSMTFAPALAQDTGTVLADCDAVSLDYWNPFTGPDGPFMGELVDAFNAEYPMSPSP